MNKNNLKESTPLFKKEILFLGKEYIPLTSGTRVKFHFQTRRCDNNILIDDSRKMDKPMELVLGKKFKLEVWEVAIQKMALNEVAKFTVDKSFVTQYPFISKTLRDVNKKVEERRHCCGMTLQNEGIGYKDLDELFANPTDLEFILELISVELPEQYQKERWQMTDEEKMIAIKDLREKGNDLYKKKDIKNSQDCYMQALGMIEQLMLKEKPHDIEWNELAELKVPLLLNYSQCRLIDNDFYAVIEHCNEVLQLEPNNVKALFRRGKAHFGAWNPELAKQDLQKAAQLDPALKSAVIKEINAIQEQQKKRDAEDRKELKKLF